MVERSAHDKPQQPVATEPTRGASPPLVSTGSAHDMSTTEGADQPLEPSSAVETIAVSAPPQRVGRLRRLWTRAWRWASPTPRLKLSADDLHARLELKSIGIIEELHALALRQIQAEEQRESRLDGKAQGLLVSASLTLTVAFTFGGLLLQHPDYLDPLQDYELFGQSAAWAVVACYAIALVCGLAASYVAIRALYVRADYQGVDEQVVLGKAILDIADDQAGEGARAAYRRYSAAHHWQIAQHNSEIHNVKADRIKFGQRLFIGFLACLMLIGLGLGYSAYTKLQHKAVTTRCIP